jgi:hypothetical protein
MISAASLLPLVLPFALLALAPQFTTTSKSDAPETVVGQEQGTAIEPAKDAQGETPVADRLAIQIVPLAELASRPYTVLAKVEAGRCTARLKRPFSDDPTQNPALAIARERLLQKGAAKGADALTNVDCFKEVRIGFGCPTRVACKGEAIRFDPAPLP